MEHLCSRFRIPRSTSTRTKEADAHIESISARVKLLDRLIGEGDKVLSSSTPNRFRSRGRSRSTKGGTSSELAESSVDSEDDSDHHLGPGEPEIHARMVPRQLPDQPSGGLAEESRLVSRLNKLPLLQRVFHHHRKDDGETGRADASRDFPQQLKLRLFRRESRGKRGPCKCAEGSLLRTPPLGEAYKVMHELGRGHLGSVSAVKCRESGQLLACKTVSKRAITTPRLLREVQMEIFAMAELQLRAKNPSEAAGVSAVELHEVADDDSAIYLIEDYCEGGDLLHLIMARGRLNERTCAAMTMQILQQLQALHCTKLVHRDIKPGNILITHKADAPTSWPNLLTCVRHKQQECSSSCFRLADFGSCGKLDVEGMLCGLYGSPKYMAPEVVKGEKYGTAVDIWSLGVVLYCCLVGKQPFTGATMQDVFNSVVNSPPDFFYPRWAAVSLDAKALVSAMLCRVPSRRITVNKALTHPWLLKFHDAGDVVVEPKPLQTLLSTSLSL